MALIAAISLLYPEMIHGSAISDQELAVRRRRFERERAAQKQADRRYEQREAAARERRLREKITTGQDDRPDKYLHAAARRRRNEEKDSNS